MILPGQVAGQRCAMWPLAYELPPLAPFDSVPSIARSHLAATLVIWHLGVLAEDAALVVSELVTNAVKASVNTDGNPRYLDGGRMPMVGMRLLSDGSRLLIEVYDQAPERPVMLAAGSGDETGRGLSIVHALTRGRWGWSEVRGGKCVWAELSAG